MALLLQATIDGRKELKLVYKLSADVEAQQFVLKDSNFKGATDTLVRVSRYYIEYN